MPQFDNLEEPDIKQFPDRDYAHAFVVYTPSVTVAEIVDIIFTYANVVAKAGLVMLWFYLVFSLLGWF